MVSSVEGQCSKYSCGQSFAACALLLVCAEVGQPDYRFHNFNGLQVADIQTKRTSGNKRCNRCCYTTGCSFGGCMADSWDLIRIIVIYRLSELHNTKTKCFIVRIRLARIYVKLAIEWCGYGSKRHRHMIFPRISVLNKNAKM